jgi:hypothetical protein
MKSENYINGKGEQYDLHVKVYTRPNLRGSETEMLMYMGKQILNNLFDIREVDEHTTSFHLEYPERWANIVELRALITRIPILYPNIQRVTITTHSVYIIQCVNREHIGIYDDPSKYPEENYPDLSVRYSPGPSQMEGLYVATPDEIRKL